MEDAITVDACLHQEDKAIVKMMGMEALGSPVCRVKMQTIVLIIGATVLIIGTTPIVESTNAIDYLFSLFVYELIIVSCLNFVFAISLKAR